MFESGYNGHTLVLPAREERRMIAGHTMARIVNFARAGYPKGVPATDAFAVLAVLPPTRPPVPGRDRHA
ncbi:DUF3349 domain-containing protein [Mycobacterium sp. TY813]|uniref:DUF3349 domain-containing protein n=1 Tax=Mycobacterium TaxID=1763 RepID=UPI0009E77BD0